MTRLLFLALGSALFTGPALAQTAPTASPDQLSAVTVFAGQYPTGEQAGAVLNALEVVRTPGTAADINRALQTLPGVQLVDEGNALFVRGGDSNETATLVNGLRYPTATRLNSPAATFAGTLNPFEARRISFASGGFGARFGNALSGVVDIDTLGAPPIHSLTLGGGLGALSLGAAAAFNDHAGMRLMATRSSTAPIFRLNGAARDYPEPPNGHDFALSGAWEYRPGAELRVFAVEQLQHLALNVNLPTQRGLFRNRTLNRLGTASWADAFGGWAVNVSVGGGSFDRREAVGTVDVRTLTEHRQFAARASYTVSDRVQFTTGADGGREEVTLTKLIPPAGSYAGGFFTADLTGNRWGTFAEADAAFAPHARAIVGVRADSSTLTHETTADPRVALAWEPRKAVTFSLAGGLYHQIPDGYNFFGDTGRRALPPMRVIQTLAAVQVGKNDRLVRLELYTKDYDDLVTLNRSYRPIGGGTGRAEGLDIFLRSSLPWAMSGRLTYSYIDTRRTDPDSGRLARAPFDVTHTASLIVDRAFGDWVASGAWRFATGRPYTPITGGVPDGRGGYSPAYGAPFSERLPSLVRFDLSASRFRRLNDHTSLVLYVSVNNVLNRHNVYTYEYAADFSSRRPTPSLFGQSVYFGFSLMFN
jgi:vitamin B12 transporter